MIRRSILALGLGFVAASALPLLAQDKPSSVARSGDFIAAQLSTTDPKALTDAWAQPTAGVELATQHETTRHQPIHIFVVFAGCKVDAAGKCHVSARFEIIDPEGNRYDRTDGVVLLDGVPPPKGNFALGAASLGLRIEDGEALGTYTVRVATTDQVAGLTLNTSDTFTVKEAPIVGGWKEVPNPATSAELRGPVRAMLARIPRKKPKLAKIESAQSQVVAGTNYRLRIRLKDGTRWEATVWRKLDRSFEVSGIGQVR